MTAGNKKKSSFPVFLHRPGSRRLASGSDPSERSQPCLLAHFFHQEVLKTADVGVLRRGLLQLISRRRP